MDQETFDKLAQIAAIARIHMMAAKVQRLYKNEGRARYHDRKVSKCASFMRDVATDIELA